MSLKTLLRRLVKSDEPAPVPADPLVGKFFLSVSRCLNCSAIVVSDKGIVLSRIPGAFAYVVRNYSVEPDYRVTRFCRVVQGSDMSPLWSFYASISDLLIDEQEILGQSHDHARQSADVN